MVVEIFSPSNTHIHTTVYSVDSLRRVVWVQTTGERCFDDMAYIDWHLVRHGSGVTGKTELDPKRPPVQGVYIMYNQAPDHEWPKPSEGPFSQFLALTPNAPMVFGHVLQGRGKGLPFAVVEASPALPHTELGTITGYRLHNPGHHHDGRTRAIPRAAYCWSPNTFPRSLDLEDTTFTLPDFVTGEALFVLEELLAIVRYLDIQAPKFADKRSYRIRRDAKRQILRALGRERATKRKVLACERMARKAGAKSCRHRAGNGPSETDDEGSEAYHAPFPAVPRGLGIRYSRTYPWNQCDPDG